MNTYYQNFMDLIRYYQSFPDKYPFTDEQIVNIENLLTSDDPLNNKLGLEILKTVLKNENE